MGNRDDLKDIGLTQEEFDDLLNKLDGFVGTLSPQQQKALRLMTGHGREAAHVLERSVRPGELESFLTTRTQSGVVLLLKKTGTP